ncbi:hypothetical protein IE077_001353 [Cardiosporidium cionae]|uniref:Uncharacterized protein n=1 Tax=Cardiosporidium cionae TaxID=476202 RepID=A0ABQ7J3X4_9APIC|nr:hypothetical protein IE077_001353 [Cardiosporidium cionae]|eukprot:KAF8817789.1 hypothetical protein IE077_001353 [Cardiosporidium cionae]
MTRLEAMGTSLNGDVPLSGDMANASDEEETFRQQDKNFANLFTYFLTTFVIKPEDDEDETMSVDESAILPYYMQQASELLTSNTGRSLTFVVNMQHILQWKVPNDTVSAGKQMYHYITKYFLRIHEVLESKLQLFMEEQMKHQLKQKEMSHYFLRLDDTLEFVHS